MQATTDIYDGKKTMKCKTILGVELVEKYLDKVKFYYPTIKTDVLKAPDLFMNNSYDVILCLDVLEHLNLSGSLYLLEQMKRITRHTVIVYTPLKFDENGDNIENAWNMGRNEFQKHKCLITSDHLDTLGYKHEVTETDGNLFGVYEK